VEKESEKTKEPEKVDEPVVAAAGGAKSEMSESKDGPKRFDPRQLKRQFMAAYGGTAEWDATKGWGDVPKKPAAAESGSPQDHTQKMPAEETQAKQAGAEEAPAEEVAVTDQRLAKRKDDQQEPWSQKKSKLSDKISEAISPRRSPRNSPAPTAVAAVESADAARARDIQNAFAAAAAVAAEADAEAARLKDELARPVEADQAATAAEDTLKAVFSASCSCAFAYNCLVHPEAGASRKRAAEEEAEEEAEEQVGVADAKPDSGAKSRRTTTIDQVLPETPLLSKAAEKEKAQEADFSPETQEALKGITDSLAGAGQFAGANSTKTAILAPAPTPAVVPVPGGAGTGSAAKVVQEAELERQRPQRITPSKIEQNVRDHPVREQEQEQEKKKEQELDQVTCSGCAVLLDVPEGAPKFRCSECRVINTASNVAAAAEAEEEECGGFNSVAAPDWPAQESPKKAFTCLVPPPRQGVVDPALEQEINAGVGPGLPMPAARHEEQDDGGTTEEEDDGGLAAKEKADSEEALRSLEEAEAAKALGLELVRITKGPAGFGMNISPEGVVAKVTPGGAAEAAGLTVGAVIVTVEGATISGREAVVAETQKYGTRPIAIGIARARAMPMEGLRAMEGHRTQWHRTAVAELEKVKAAEQKRQAAARKQSADKDKERQARQAGERLVEAKAAEEKRKAAARIQPADQDKDKDKERHDKEKARAQQAAVQRERREAKEQRRQTNKKAKTTAQRVTSLLTSAAASSSSSSSPAASAVVSPGRAASSSAAAYAVGDAVQAQWPADVEGFKAGPGPLGAFKRP
jgi:LSD1 subclass zinc finger protein